jgi:hypothetical protein
LAADLCKCARSGCCLAHRLFFACVCLSLRTELFVCG